MKKYEVIIDFESFPMIIEANNKEEAEQKGYDLFNKEHSNELPDFWVGECYEVEEDDDAM